MNNENEACTSHLGARFFIKKFSEDTHDVREQEEEQPQHPHFKIQQIAILGHYRHNVIIPEQNRLPQTLDGKYTVSLG